MYLSAGRCSTIYRSTLALQVNGIDLRNATHDEAINVLRQTPQKVRLTVYRDEAQYKEEDMYDVLNIELQKKPGKGLGLSIVGKRYVMYLEIQCLELSYHVSFVVWCSDPVGLKAIHLIFVPKLTSLS